MEQSEISRRRFAALAALLGATGACAAGVERAAAQDNPAANLPADEMTPAEHALRILLARYPDERLNAAAQVSLLVDLERHLGRSKVLSSVALENGDEPGFTFRAVLRQERNA
ncbi:MAG: hypothetical protein U0939_14610 [Pirellulales bacterium]